MNPSAEQNYSEGFNSDEGKIHQLNSDNTNNVDELQIDNFLNFPKHNPGQHVDHPHSISRGLEYPLDLDSEHSKNDQLLNNKNNKSLSELNHSSRKINKVSTAHRDPLRSLNTDNIVEATSKNKPTRKRKSYWTPEEDAQVQDLTAGLGEKWTVIGKMLGNRTGKQVRDRYKNFLASNVSNTKFTHQEDVKLFELTKKFGTKWTQIAARMPKRSEYQVKNRYYSIMRKDPGFAEKFAENFEYATEELKEDEGVYVESQIIDEREKFLLNGEQDQECIITDPSSVVCDHSSVYMDESKELKTDSKKLILRMIDSTKMIRKKELQKEISALEHTYQLVLKELKTLEDFE